ncbi:hypothetical protein [Salinisphaera sp. PC39]|uniref:hypothetical protein n=1 Tax=Salinisphaera sp. PC39 TaxID=1304156 RepID=UPI00333E6C3C
MDVWFPRDNQRIERHCLAEKMNLIEGDFVTVAMSDPEESPATTEEVYLRLHLLSELALRPNDLPRSQRLRASSQHAIIRCTGHSLHSINAANAEVAILRAKYAVKQGV